MSTEGETLQVSVLPYRCSIYPPLVMRQMSVPATHVRDHPGYCTAEVGNPGGTYELPCIKFLRLKHSDSDIFRPFLEGHPHGVYRNICVKFML